VEIFLRR